MEKIDKEVVLRKLKELDQNISQLKKHIPIESDDLDNLDTKWLIERGLMICIQITLDVGSHILSATGTTPESYAEIYDQLEKNGIITKKFADKIRGMAGLRNILVHEYTEVDPDIVTDILNKQLDDFITFAEQIMSYLK